MVKKETKKQDVSVKSTININNDKKNVNYYKIATFLLVGIIIILGGIYLFSWYGNVKANEGFLIGEQNVFNQMIVNLQKDGYVTFGEGNNTVTLVPVQMIQMQREQTILEILKQVEENGYVQLYNNETEVILVPYQGTQE